MGPTLRTKIAWSSRLWHNSRRGLSGCNLNMLNKYRFRREGLSINMDRIFYEHLTRPGRFTLEEIPIKNHYKHEVIMNEFVTIADNFGLSDDSSHDKLLMLRDLI